MAFISFYPNFASLRPTKRHVTLSRISALPFPVTRCYIRTILAKESHLCLYTCVHGAWLDAASSYVRYAARAHDFVCMCVVHIRVERLRDCSVNCDPVYRVKLKVLFTHIIYIFFLFRKNLKQLKYI